MVEIEWSDKAKRNFKKIITDFKDNSLNAANSFKKVGNETIEYLRVFS